MCARVGGPVHVCVRACGVHARVCMRVWRPCTCVCASVPVRWIFAPPSLYGRSSCSEGCDIQRTVVSSQSCLPKTGTGRGEGRKTRKAASWVRRAATRWESGSREPGTGKLEGWVLRG